MERLSEPFASSPHLLEPEEFPYLRTMSAGHMHRLAVVPSAPVARPEFVFVPPLRDFSGADAERVVACGEWNLMWEWGEFRPDQILDKLPKRLRWIANHPKSEFRLVCLDPGPGGKFQAYEPIRSLLPLGTLARFGLRPEPSLWPSINGWQRAQPVDRTQQLASAFSAHIWPILSPRTRQSALSASEPLKLLSHSLDFWLPHVDTVVQQRVKSFGRIGYDSETSLEDLEDLSKSLQLGDEATVVRPLLGGDAWRGEDDAWEATQEVVEAADAGGRLRGMIDAVRSHRVADDFSDRWSFEREDFERKLHGKRRKIKVAFVEFDETVAVHSPSTECDPETRLMWQDFFSILDEKEKRVVVCLRSSSTTATEAASELGYANHSAVSKALKRIRLKAEKALG